MEQTKASLTAHIASLEKACGTLEDAIGETYSDIVRDAVIQRFEYVFELAWKTIQIAGRFMGSSCSSPREAIKLAFKLEWITNPEMWLESMEARNQTSHTYNEILANEVYQTAKKFPGLVNSLLIFLRKI
ncbi:MAG: nucleotidyltransferase substrate binding protein [Candidatus Omnitrophica bacterium]|nr:nucleotidyltransferase substrate binding protein [Candidatus Omnitrophota bacterium]